jgi:hypothetical protein
LSFGVHTLVVAEDVVLCKLAGKLTALAADSGQKLWDCEGGDGFHAPVDVFVIDGLVWQGFHPSDSIAPPPVKDFSEGRDLRTGEVKATNRVAVDLQTSGHHHRCYREKATERFILAGYRGIELIDLQGSEHSRNNWVRGGCQYGILPANGLIYTPPHACGCYMEAKLRGFWALAADSPARRASERADRRCPATGDRPGIRAADRRVRRIPCRLAHLPPRRAPQRRGRDGTGRGVAGELDDEDRRPFDATGCRGRQGGRFAH